MLRGLGREGQRHSSRDKEEADKTHHGMIDKPIVVFIPQDLRPEGAEA